MIRGSDIAELMERDAMQERLDHIDAFLEDFTWETRPPVERVQR